jgi:hypothetical protein
MPPELSTEDAAIDTLMSAVMAPDEHVLDAPDLDPPQNVDDETNDGEPREEGDKEPEQKAETKQATDPEEDEIEITGEEGQEPTRIKLAEVLEGYQQFKAIETQKAQIIERVEQETVAQATTQLRQVEQVARQAATQVQAALQLLQPPQPPNAETMLNPASPQYDPDSYHRQFAVYQRAMGQFQQAQGVARELQQQAQQAAAQATEQREMAELNKLKRVWPEFGEKATTDSFISEMNKAYGYSPEELDASLIDHRNALVARDALAYRKLMAKSGDVKKAVETKKATLVRSKQESKTGSVTARDGKGQFVSGALANLKQTNSDDAAAAYFTGLVKAGRI